MPRAQSSLPLAPPATTGLLLGRIAAFLFLVFLSSEAVTAQLMASPADTIGRMHLWQLLTSLFVLPVSGGGLVQLIFELLLVYWIGGEVEPRWGQRGFLLLFFVAGIIGNLATCSLGMFLDPNAPTYGAVFATTALLVAWGIVHRGEQRLMFGRLPVRPEIVAGLFVAIPVLADLLGRRYASVAGELLAVLTAFAMVRGYLDPHVYVGRALRKRYRVLEGGKSRKDPTLWN
jgi:membrane associated rhomboid family serine protease